MPATSRPVTWAASSAMSTFSSCASQVRSMEMPPVDMFPVAASLTKAPSSGTSSSENPCFPRSSIAASSILILVRTFSCPRPLRGSSLVTSTSSFTVCRPSPVTWAGIRSATATIRPPTTSIR
jgi:hypothetical protein